MIHYILRILLSQRHVQLQHEEQMVVQVLYPTLDTWYDHDGSIHNKSNVQMHLQFFIQTLRRPLWMKQQQHQFVHDMIELILEQISQQQQDEEYNQIESRTTTISLSSYQKKLHQYHFPVSNKNRNHSSNSDDDVENTNAFKELHHDGTTAEQLFDQSTDPTTTTTSPVQEIINELFSFIQRANNDNNIKNNNVTTIFILGSVGSGKTYICNQIAEQSIPSTTFGM